MIQYIPSYFLASSSLTKCGLHKGDMIFFTHPKKEQTAKIDSFGQAIIASHQSTSISSTAIIYDTTEVISIVHATTRGVVLEPLEYSYNMITAWWTELKFFRVSSNLTIGEEAANCAHSYIGLSYNDIFANNQTNSKGETSFYCSQLVEFCFNNVTTTPTFHKHKLNFHDVNGNILEYWVNYYKDRGMEVPDDDIGTHPGSLYETAVAGLIPIDCDQ